MFYGGIEAGGTKFVCGIGKRRGKVIDNAVFPTSTPEDTLEKVAAYFKDFPQEGDALEGIGLASFGPIDLNPASETYGFITSTPKKKWQFFDIIGHDGSSPFSR